MPISVTGSSIDPMMSRRTGGFTLLEILVVLVIIGVMVGLVSLSIGRPQGDELRTEAQRLQALLHLAAEESLMQGQEYGVQFSSHGYAFQRLTSEGWQSLAEDKVLRARKLPSAMRLRLSVDGSPVELGQGGGKVQVYLLSSGEMTPFQLVLRSAEGAEIQLDGLITGQVRIDDAQS